MEPEPSVITGCRAAQRELRFEKLPLRCSACGDVRAADVLALRASASASLFSRKDSSALHPSAKLKTQRTGAAGTHLLKTSHRHQRHRIDHGLDWSKAVQ